MKILCVGYKGKHRHMITVKQDMAGENCKCPKCGKTDFVYVHLDNYKSDPIEPRFLCIVCQYEWDEKEDRLSGH